MPGLPTPEDQVSANAAPPPPPPPTGADAPPPPPAATADVIAGDDVVRAAGRWGGDGSTPEEEKKVETSDGVASTTTSTASGGAGDVAATAGDGDREAAASTTAEEPPVKPPVHMEDDAGGGVDDEDGADLLPSNEDGASCLSSWLLLYVTPLLRLGATRVLEPVDVGPPSLCDRAGPCHDKVRALWTAEVARVGGINEREKAAHGARVRVLPPDATSGQWKRAGGRTYVPRNPSLAMVLWNAFGYWRVWYAIALYILSALLQFMPVLILTDLVRYFESSSKGGGDGDEYRALLLHPWGNVVGLFVFPMIVSLLQTRSQVILNHCAIFIRTSVSTLLFSKALTISAAGRAQTSTGQVVNMMSNDTQQLQRFLQFFGFTLVAPIQIVISLVLIYRQVGNATWVGIAFMVLLIPVNGVVFSKVSTMRRRVLKYSDARVKMINEILTGIRIIKYYAWEGPFGREVQRLREKELKALTTLAYTTAIGFSLIMLSAPIINPMLVFLAYIHMSDDGLDAATAFTTIALFNIMRFPFAFLPMGFLQLVQSRIALVRLSKYLVLPELESYVVPGLPGPADGKAHPAPGEEDGGALFIEDGPPSDPAVVINDGTFSWVDPDAAPPPPPPSSPRRRSGCRGGKNAIPSGSEREERRTTMDRIRAPTAAVRGGSR